MPQGRGVLLILVAIGNLVDALGQECRQVVLAAPMRSVRRHPPPGALRLDRGGGIHLLPRLILGAYDHLVGLDLTPLAVDGCITKVSCSGEEIGRRPVDGGKQGRKRSVVVDGQGPPLGRVIALPTRHDSRLLEPTWDLLAPSEPFPEPPTVHLDRG